MSHRVIRSPQPPYRRSARCFHNPEEAPSHGYSDCVGWMRRGAYGLPSSLRSHCINTAGSLSGRIATWRTASVSQRSGTPAKRATRLRRTWALIGRTHAGAIWSGRHAGGTKRASLEAVTVRHATLDTRLPACREIAARRHGDSVTAIDDAAMRHTAHPLNPVIA